MLADVKAVDGIRRHVFATYEDKPLSDELRDGGQVVTLSREPQDELSAMPTFQDRRRHSAGRADRVLLESADNVSMRRRKSIFCCALGGVE